VWAAAWIGVIAAPGCKTNDDNTGGGFAGTAGAVAGFGGAGVGGGAGLAAAGASGSFAGSGGIAGMAGAGVGGVPPAGSGGAGGMVTGGAGGMAGAGAGGSAGAAGAAGAGGMPSMCIMRGMMMGEDPACTACVCSMCAAESMAVYEAADATFGMKAQAVITCVRTECCVGSDCYCGEGSVANPLICITPGPMGPCKAQIEAATGIMDDAIMIQTACDPAMSQSACAAAQRFGDCVLGDETATPAVVGKCPMCDSCP
jgi:hypothetical protein